MQQCHDALHGEYKQIEAMRKSNIPTHTFVPQYNILSRMIFINASTLFFIHRSSSSRFVIKTLT